MKKTILMFVIFAMVAVGFTGCKSGESLESPDYSEYPEYIVGSNMELGCVELSYEGIVYRPFGVFFNSDFRGAQIGIREAMPESKICEVKGYPSAEWITEYLDVQMGGGDMLFKAVSVTEIPEELAQYKEYEY